MKVFGRLAAIDARRPLGAITAALERMERVCAALDYGVVPERYTVELLRTWEDIFDCFPDRGSPGYHALRAYFGWESVERSQYFGTPYYKQLDRREDREDGCEHLV